jgi:hypothetical protein
MNISASASSSSAIKKQAPFEIRTDKVRSATQGSKSNSSEEVLRNTSEVRSQNDKKRNNTTLNASRAKPKEKPLEKTVSPRSINFNRSTSIVVQLSGEMGNHLQKIAFGRAIQNMLFDKYGIASDLVLQHQQRGGKWVSAMRDLKQCFPKLRHFDFELGNSPEFTERLQQQKKWLGDKSAELIFPNLVSIASVDQGLDYLANLLRTNHSSIPEIGIDANISLPFVYAQSFVDFPFIDQYYSDLRKFFSFDDASCCMEIPRPDESVFVSNLLYSTFPTQSYFAHEFLS